MTQIEFYKFLEDCRRLGGKAGAAAILFELGREEMETNSQYSAAHQVVKELLSSVQIDTNTINQTFAEIQQDENDHSVKYEKMASALIGIKLGNPND